ncbi:MAG: HNH endonuclease signature motif containing protein [Dehalococcoidia bacterium]
MDHIIPRSRRRDSTDAEIRPDIDDPANLAAACSHCNRRKADFMTGRDPLSGGIVRLLHPRRDAWDEHFAWSSDFLRILPLSDIGGATIARLRVNEPVLVRQRRLLRQAMAAGGSPWP